MVSSVFGVRKYMSKLVPISDYFHILVSLILIYYYIYWIGCKPKQNYDVLQYKSRDYH